MGSERCFGRPTAKDGRLADSRETFMQHHEIAGLMTALAPVVGEFVSKAVAPLRAENQALLNRLETMEQRFADIPTREENSVVILRLVEETVAKVPPTPPTEVDLVEVERIVSEKVESAVSALPTPAPGKDADPETISRMVQEEVAKLPPAQPGKDADPEMVAALVDKAVAAIEPAKDGAPGPAGESVTLEQLVPLVVETVAKAVADELEKVAVNLPAGKDGAPGEPGKSVTAEELAPLVDEIVIRRMSELPPAKDGAAGKEGSPGRDGRDGLPGVQGERGADGRDGIDGKNGLGIDDFDVKAIDDGRMLEFSLKREGAEPIVKTVDVATVLDRGVWREQAYSKGDGVTWGGSFFIAQRATAEADKPGNSDAWRLGVKKGRDGKDGLPGKQGQPGPKGDPGERGFPGRNAG